MIVKAIRLFLLLDPVLSRVEINDLHEYHKVIHAMMGILNNCLFREDRRVLLLTGDYEQFLRHHRDFFANVTVSLVSEKKSSSLDHFALTRYFFHDYQNFKLWKILQKLHIFVIMTPSQPKLRLALQKLTDSPWANYLGFYIFIDQKTVERGCINAAHFLWTAWEYNTLSVVFICLDPEEGVLVYTYDPYAEISRDDWQKAGGTEGRNGHPWTLLKRRYQSGSSICKNLYYDKTMNLYGYEIRLNAVAMEPYLSVNRSKQGMDRFSGDNAETIKSLLSTLNASAAVRVYNDSIYALGEIDHRGVTTGMLNELTTSKVDIGMNTRALFIMWFLRQTYPHAESGLCVITQFAGFASELHKLMQFLSLPYIGGIIAVCAIIHITLMKRQEFVEASLNIVRLFVCVSVLRPPEVNSSRITLCMGLLMFLIINAAFQSHWSSLLTVPVINKNVDTIEDLLKSKYDIYGANILKGMLSEPTLQSRYHVAGYDECKQVVKEKSGVACVSDCLHLFHRIKSDRSLHRSRKKIREFSQTFMTRKNWPLSDRVSHLVQRMVEAGLVRMWRRASLHELRKEKRAREGKPDKQSFSVLVLDQLAFSFYILLTGQVLATIVFLIELFMPYYRPNRKKKCKINRNKEKKKPISEKKTFKKKQYLRMIKDPVLLPWTP